MHRLGLVLLLLLFGCGTSTPPSFTCGDGGPTCQTPNQYCDIVTKSGAETATCQSFPSGCSFCACLIDSGTTPACSGFGSTTCTPKDDGTYTVTTSCIP